jgi:thiol:disulfide interchange protein DsbD
MEIFGTDFETLLAAQGLIVLLAAFVAGVLTSATPCVYPMIPITVSVIGANSESSKLKNFFLALVYVSGMALVYALLGVISASTGMFFGSISTNPWIFLIIGNLCILFAAWMMGWIAMPNWSMNINIKNQQGKYLLVFVSGIASGLIAAPCTAPVLAVILSYVATTGDAVYGGLVLFIFAFGMGTLLIIIGTFSGIAGSMPKPGVWMDRIKIILSLIILFAGEYFLLKAGENLFL